MTQAQSSPESLTGDILLDAGTNELEVLVFSLGTHVFGVNVAKVREVIRTTSTYKTPGQHASVVGMFNIRGAVIPLVDLAKHLGMSHAKAADEGRVIITEFNGLRTGFLVDSVEQIYRISWQRVRPTPSLSGLANQTVGGIAPSSTTGIVEIKDRLVQMVDFESVADSILLQDKLRVERVDNAMGIDRSAYRVVLAEDSPFMRAVIQRVFTGSGYSQLRVCKDGQEAWETLQQLADAGTPAHALVSDIEMPRIDGLYLCKRLREDARFKGLRICLFSSLISDDNLKKGQQVGADVQVAKPELAEMVGIVDRLVAGMQVSAKAA
jgi:two-component system, chemotaxis family, chemotaxis protein CheV